MLERPFTNHVHWHNGLCWSTVAASVWIRVAQPLASLVWCSSAFTFGDSADQEPWMWHWRPSFASYFSVGKLARQEACIFPAAVPRYAVELSHQIALHPRQIPTRVRAQQLCTSVAQCHLQKAPQPPRDKSHGKTPISESLKEGDTSTVRAGYISALCRCHGRATSHCKLAFPVLVGVAQPLKT